MGKEQIQDTDSGLGAAPLLVKPSKGKGGALPPSREPRDLPMTSQSAQQD